MKEKIYENLRTKMETFCKKAVNTASPIVRKEVKEQVTFSIKNVELNLVKTAKLVCLCYIFMRSFSKEESIDNTEKIMVYFV